MSLKSAISGAVQAQACTAPNVQDWVPDFLAQNLGLLTPSLILLSALAAGWGVISQRGTARRRATLDMIEKVESAPHYRSLHAIFSYHRRTNSLLRLNDPKEAKDKEDRQSVLDYLNHYELVSIGILRGTLDEAIYKKWMFGPFVRDWNAASDFVQRERWKWDPKKEKWDYHHQLFEHYQKIAIRWDHNAINLNEHYKAPPKEPEGPGDELLPAEDEDP